MGLLNIDIGYKDALINPQFMIYFFLAKQLRPLIYDAAIFEMMFVSESKGLNDNRFTLLLI